MGKAVYSVLLGLLCFILSAEQGTSSRKQDHQVEKKEPEVERLLEILQNKLFRKVQESDGNGNNSEDGKDTMNESKTGHGWEMDAKVLDPDSDVGHLAESFIDVYNGQDHKAKGVDPRKSKGYKGTNMDSHHWTAKQKAELDIKGSAANKRNFLKIVKIWPQGIVPYEISNDFDRSQRAIIDGAINEISMKTCIKFEPRNKNHASQLGHNSYIGFVNYYGCWSYVGKVLGYRQPVSLMIPSCVNHLVAIHEICHAIGIVHEQNRSDRDKYLKIFWNNVHRGTNNFNLKRLNTQNSNPYDAESVLQYGLYAFSVNGKKTLQFKDPRLNFLADTKTGLAFYDVWDITTKYKCTAKCKNPPVCQNGGFVDHRCKCFCPNGTKGSTCESPDTDPGCGGIVDVTNRSQDITTPNYPSNYNTNTKCVWLVKAAAEKLVKMDINDFHLPDNSDDRCYHWLEIRYNLPGQTGPRECGNATRGSYKTTPDGVGNLMILIFDSKFSKDKAPSRGFNITVSGVGQGCKNHPCVYGRCKPTKDDYTCTCVSGFSGKNCDKAGRNAVLTCTFDDDKCFMDNSKHGDFDWLINSGNTPSGGTGPSDAHSGSQYLYAEMSSPRRRNDIAVFESTSALPASKFCLSMFYHMYGGTVKTLRVSYRAKGVSKTELWSRTGNKGNTWYNAKIDIPSSTNTKIFIEAIRGGSWNSDIAIDDLKLKTGSCLNHESLKNVDPSPKKSSNGRFGMSTLLKRLQQAVTSRGGRSRSPATGPVYTCSFEPSSPCFLVNDKFDDFDWTIQQGSTLSGRTGPTEAAEGSYYAYIEASSHIGRRDTAILVSWVAFPPVDHCLRFQYHMYGNDKSKLRVFVGLGPKPTSVWETSGNNSNQWSMVEINIKATAYLLIRFEGSRGDGYGGDIAIDDIKLVPGPCNAD